MGNDEGQVRHLAAEHDIWLSLVLGYGNSAVKEIYKAFGSSVGFFDYCKGRKEIVAPLTPTQKSRIHKIASDDIYRILEKCQKEGIYTVGYDDERYPERLKEIPNPPTLIYVKGELPDMDEECAVTIVGPRKVSDYGSKAAFSLSRRLAAAGVLIISGGAVGADEFAHKGALSVEMPTVAVLGCGIDNDYPKENKPLRERIAKCGALISEYPPEYPALKTNYPQRNRILSALSCGTVVIEAGGKSGALITASYAAEQGRDVFVIPGSPSLPEYEGSNKLIKDGANPLLSAADILEVYYPIFKSKLDLQKAADISNGGQEFIKETRTERQKPSSLKKETKEETKEAVLDEETLSMLTDSARKIILSPIKAEFTVDDAVTLSNQSAGDTLSALTELEIFGLIKTLPGARYKKI